MPGKWNGGRMTPNADKGRKWSKMGQFLRMFFMDGSNGKPWALVQNITGNTECMSGLEIGC